MSTGVLSPSDAPVRVTGTRPGRPDYRPLTWLGAAAVAGLALLLLYPDSYQQDGGTHFLGARWAFRPGHHYMLVDVWGRPLFTVLYALPAQLGYTAARAFTVLVCLATAWHTWRLADDLGFDRSHLAIPLLFLQPSYLLLSADTMTEPLFALLFVIALRLHVAGRVRAGMLTASALILARPEGFFVALLWGVWVLLDRRDPRPWWRRLPSVLLLASGAVAWWLAALLITHDPLYILHNWPSNWAGMGTYGTGSFWTYWRARGDIVGPVLVIPFLVGLALLLARRRAIVLTSSVLTLFAVHSVLRAYGMFGSAGYARYFVCVSPAIALVTLAGWNLLADAVTDILALFARRRVGRAVVGVASAAVLLASAWKAARHVDGMVWSRDARAVADTYAWFRAHPRPVRQLVWSQVYMAILFDWDPWKTLPLTGDEAHDISVLADAPPGTLVFWDADTGPSWYGLGPAELEAAGYTRLRARRYVLPGYLRGSPPRRQTILLYYK